MDVHDGTHGASEIDEDRHQVDEEANHDPSAPWWFEGWSMLARRWVPEIQWLEIRMCQVWSLVPFLAKTIVLGAGFLMGEPVRFSFKVQSEPFLLQ